MKRTIEVKADPGGTLTFDEIERFIAQARAEGAGSLGTTVKATVRFNGTLRAIAVEMEDRPRGESGQFVSNSNVGGSVKQVRNVAGDVALMAEDDAWLAQQW